ncbi:hypothetical protein CC78DRAFT_581866 [Lojkania enalia]|uniref:Uncharacterized protein n=1 Tax=Lojkania enalia TaxID=147567 RepID=A0A9P4N263_9PLEO|nr:hypothetical protein CC78DRAFT_581866 [Didymosphaeria enalia]
MAGVARWTTELASDGPGPPPDCPRGDSRAAFHDPTAARRATRCELLRSRCGGVERAGGPLRGPEISLTAIDCGQGAGNLCTMPTDARHTRQFTPKGWAGCWRLRLVKSLSAPARAVVSPPKRPHHSITLTAVTHYPYISPAQAVPCASRSLHASSIHSLAGPPTLLLIQTQSHPVNRCHCARKDKPTPRRPRHTSQTCRSHRQAFQSSFRIVPSLVSVGASPSCTLCKQSRSQQQPAFQGLLPPNSFNSTTYGVGAMRSLQQIVVFFFALFVCALAQETISYDATVYITSTVYRVNTITMSGTPTASLANSTTTISATAGTIKPSYYPSVNATTVYPTGSMAPSGPASSSPLPSDFPGAASSLRVNVILAAVAAGAAYLAL